MLLDGSDMDGSERGEDDEEDDKGIKRYIILF